MHCWKRNSNWKFIENNFCSPRKKTNLCEQKKNFSLQKLLMMVLPFNTAVLQCHVMSSTEEKKEQEEEERKKHEPVLISVLVYVVSCVRSSRRRVLNNVFLWERFFFFLFRGTPEHKTATVFLSSFRCFVFHRTRRGRGRRGTFLCCIM